MEWMLGLSSLTKEPNSELPFFLVFDPGQDLLLPTDTPVQAFTIRQRGSMSLLLEQRSYSSSSEMPTS
jgi:hypothetical protein